MLSKEEVDKIAKLSKLKFNEEETKELQKELNSIFEYIEIINEVDVKDVKPLYHPLDLFDSLREDKVLNTLTKEDFLKNSYNKDEDFIVVPKIVE